MTRYNSSILQILAGAVFLLAGCGAGEVPLLPAERDGLFYTSFAAAQQMAQKDGKHILFELWRPG
jgi:hypothetical protein